MAYEKRVCVLRQIKKGFSADGSELSGAVYCERLGSELTVTPRILGIAPVKEGRYVLAIRAEGETALLELCGNSPLKVKSFPSVKAGFCVLLAFMRGEAEPIAFGSCGAEKTHYSTLLAAFSQEKRKKRDPLPPPPDPDRTPIPLSPNTPILPQEEDRPFREEAAARYDDEAIADVNYFGDAGDDDGETVPHRQDGEKEKKDGQNAPPHAGDEMLRPRGTLTYYNSVREKLERVLKTFPRDERLKDIFPNSEWVKADKSLLGVIYEEGIPKYLCVAAEDSETLPPAMKEHGCFVPVSPLSDMVGVYVVFQSADTGEYVTVSSG